MKNHRFLKLPKSRLENSTNIQRQQAKPGFPGTRESRKVWRGLVHPARLERATCGFEVRRSIQLSYGCMARIVL